MRRCLHNSMWRCCVLLSRHSYGPQVTGELYDDVFFCREQYCPVKRRFTKCEAEIRRRDHGAAVRVLSSRKLASYQKPRLGAGFQCAVPPFGRSSSPSRERGDKLVFEGAGAFQGSATRSAAADKLLQSFRINDSSSAGVSEEIALMALFRTGGDVNKTDAQLKRLKEQHLTGSDAAAASAERRQAAAMEREKREHERDLIQERSQELAAKLDMGDAVMDAVVALPSGAGLAAGIGQGAHGSAAGGTPGRRHAISSKHAGSVQLNCERAHPDGNNSNKGIYFDIENKTSSSVLVTGFAAGTFDLAAEVSVWACSTGRCQDQVGAVCVWR
jgi:hypothetical protein